MPPPAVRDPVNKNPITVMDTNPAVCQVAALVNNRRGLSIVVSFNLVDGLDVPDGPLCGHLVNLLR